MRVRPRSARAAPVIRQPVPAYDRDLLRDCLGKHVVERGVKRAFDLGEYAHVPVAHAVRGTALAQQEHLLRALLTAAPAAEVHYRDVKQVVRTLCLQYSGLNSTQQDNETWAGGVAERLMTLLTHLRRLKTSSVRWRQAALNMTKDDQDTLQELLDCVAHRPGSAATSAPSSSAAAPPPAPQLAGGSRQLARNDSAASAVSLDSQGFPAVLSRLGKVPERAAPAPAPPTPPTPPAPRRGLSHLALVAVSPTRALAYKAARDRALLAEPVPPRKAEVRRVAAESKVKPVLKCVKKGPILKKPATAAPTAPAAGSAPRKDWVSKFRGVCSRRLIEQAGAILGYLRLGGSRVGVVLVVTPGNQRANPGWHIMWYNARKAAAVRERGGQKRQLFQLRSPAGWTRDQVEAVAQQAIKKLIEGKSVGTARDWAQKQLM